MRLEDSQVAVTISIYKMPLIWPNSAYLLSWETSDSVWCFKCGVVPLWLVAQQHRVTWIETQVFSLAAKLDVPGSAPGPAPTQDLQCRDQHLNHRSPQGKGWPCIQLPATAPRRSSGPALYALAASQPALSQQTRKHSNRFTHTSSYLALIIYPVRSHTSALLPQTHWMCTWPKQYVSTDD